MTSRFDLAVAALFALLPLAILAGVEGEPFDLLQPLCILFAAQLAWSLWSVRRGGFSPYLIVFVSMALFNGGQALLGIFGLNEGGMLGGEFTPAELVRGLSFVISALGALQLGALLAGAAPDRPAPSSEAGLRAMHRAGLLLYAISIGPLLVRVWTATQVVLAGGYMALYQDYAPAGADSVVIILEGFVLPASLLLLAARRGRLAGFWLPWTTLAAYAGSQLFLGYRANAVFPLIAALWVSHRAVRKVRWAPVVAASAVLLLLVFPLVRKTRTVRGSERASLSFLEDALQGVEQPFRSVLSEMGGSMQTVVETMRLVPSSHPYELGEGYAYASLTVVPSLFWERHPTIARGTPAVWLTQQIDPVQSALGGSVGYSAIAETFLNFGLAGPLVMLLSGFLLVKASGWASRQGAAGIAILGSLLPSLLFVARGDASMLTRPILWYGLGPYLLVLLLAHARKSSLRPASA